MKLKSILYEEGNPLTMVSKGPAQQPGSSSVISYTAPNFALFVNEDGNTPDLTLVNVPALLRYLTLGNAHDPLPLYDIIAGYISLRDSGNECLTAMQVELVASSPKYPGAGMTMYALASDHFSTPITSDRHMSTSKQGKQTWAKIESDTANWQRGGAPLDNYGQIIDDGADDWSDVNPEDNNSSQTSSATSDTKKALSAPDRHYVDIVGTYPHRSIGLRQGPRTPSTVDDCPIPNKYGNVKDVSVMSDNLGTAEVWTYKGPIKAAPLIQAADRLTKVIASKRGTGLFDYIAKNPQFFANAGMEMFKQRYASRQM